MKVDLVIPRRNGRNWRNLSDERRRARESAALGKKCRELRVIEIGE